MARLKTNNSFIRQLPNHPRKYGSLLGTLEPQSCFSARLGGNHLSNDGKAMLSISFRFQRFRVPQAADETTAARKGIMWLDVV